MMYIQQLPTIQVELKIAANPFFGTIRRFDPWQGIILYPYKNSSQQNNGFSHNDDPKHFQHCTRTE
jgi:hypothetical protein